MDDSNTSLNLGALSRPLRVFLCHAPGDKPAVRDLYKRLEEQGIAPWLDEEILLPGQNTEQEIRKALRAADVVVVCLSHHSITSSGHVQREISLALNVAEEQPEGSIFLIPIKLEICVTPERLAQWHSVHLFESNGFNRLLQALAKRADEIASASSDHDQSQSTKPENRSMVLGSLQSQSDKNTLSHLYRSAESYSATKQLDRVQPLPSEITESSAGPDSSRTDESRTVLLGDGNQEEDPNRGSAEKTSVPVQPLNPGSANSASLPHVHDANPKPHMAVIMRGGGVKGLAYIGALKELSKYYDFDWFIGTSAGAIAAVLLAAGYSLDELEEILSRKDFRDFLDAKPHRWFINLLFYGGIFPANTFTNWLEQMLAKKLDSPTQVTLAKLPYRVTVFASQKGQKAVVFDSHREESKNSPAAYAVRASMSIPFIFTPQMKDGMRAFDGGLRNNFPVDISLRENPGLKFIGLFLGPEHFEGDAGRESITRELLSIVTEAPDIEALAENLADTVIIDPRPIQTTDFSLTNEEKDFLIKAGRASALSFLYKRHISPAITEDNVRVARLEAENARQQIKVNREKRARFKKRLLLASVIAVMVILILLNLRPIDKSVSITSFSDGQTVPRQITVEGTYQGLSEDEEIWLAVVSSSSRTAFPYKATKLDDHRWEARDVIIGPEEPIGQGTYKIHVITANPETSRILESLFGVGGILPDQVQTLRTYSVIRNPIPTPTPPIQLSDVPLYVSVDGHLQKLTEIEVHYVAVTPRYVWLTLKKDQETPYGLARLDEQGKMCLFQHLAGEQICNNELRNSIETDAISAVWALEEEVWIGIDGLGVLHGTVDSQGNTSFKKVPGVAFQDDVLSIYRDTKRQLWIGTTGGLYKLPEGSQKPALLQTAGDICKQASSGETNFEVRDIAEDATGLWFATNVGIVHVLDGTGNQVCHQSNGSSTCDSSKQLPTNDIWSVVVTKDGIWGGTGNGKIVHLSESEKNNSPLIACWQVEELRGRPTDPSPSRVNELGLSESGFPVAASEGGLFYRSSNEPAWKPASTTEKWKALDFEVGAFNCAYVATSRGLRCLK